MQSSYLLINDIRLHYRYANLADGTRNVLLLHGLASNARIWEKCIPNLAANGLAVYAPDLRGHGLSDRPEGDYGFETFARDLATMVDICGISRPILIGHSWGAMLALDYAARFSIGPLAPAALVLVDGGISQLNDLPGVTWESVQERMAPPRLAGTPLTDFLDRMDSFNSAWRPDEQDISIILSNFEIDLDECISPRLSFENHMKIVRAMWDFPTFERYKRLRCPLLTISARPVEPHSAREREFLALKQGGLERIRQIKPDAQAVWMTDSVHDIPLQRAGEMVQTIINFLGS